MAKISLFDEFKALLINLACPGSLPDNSIPRQGVERLLKDGYSLVRWGDGEVALLRGRGIPFQGYSHALSKEIDAVLKSDHTNLIIAAPYLFTCQSVPRLVLAKKFRIWRLSRAFFITNFYRAGKEYANAFGFRAESGFEYLEILRDLISASHSTTVVARDGADIDGFLLALESNRSVERVLVPAQSCYSGIDEIEGRICHKSKGDLILLSCGPTAKAIIGRCIGSGAQLIDVGHLFDQVQQSHRQGG